VKQDAINAAVLHLLSMIEREREEAGLSPADRAELRRMDPQGTLPPALWRLLTANAVANGVTALGAEWEQAERAVASLVQVMLEAGGPPEPHSIGRALAETNYAEQRFVLLLRARGPRDVAAQARTAVRWCTTEGIRVRFPDSGGRKNGFAAFILDASLDRPGADSRAHAMARDYFTGTQPQNDEETPDGE